MSTERRTQTRERVFYGASASSDTSEARRNCVVRNFSNAGALVEFSGFPRRPNDELSLTIERKSNSYRAHVVWWRENLAGVSFAAGNSNSATAEQDLEMRLRKSERKTRQLRRQIREALGQD